MELFLSYSLQDFLLFSAETWFFLYQEFTRKWWSLAVLICAILLATMLTRLKAFQYASMLILLLSMTLYYWEFYIEINEFAIYLVILLAMQTVIYVIWTWRQQDEITLRGAKYVKSSSSNKKKEAVWIFVLSVVVFMSLPLYTNFESQTTLFLLFLPGWQAFTSGLFFVFFARYYQSTPVLCLSPIIVVIVSELLTFKVLPLPYWWIGMIALIGALYNRS